MLKKILQCHSESKILQLKFCASTQNQPCILFRGEHFANLVES